MTTTPEQIEAARLAHRAAEAAWRLDLADPKLFEAAHKAGAAYLRAKMERIRDQAIESKD